MFSEIHDKLLRAYTTFNSGEPVPWSMFHPSIVHDQSEGLFLDGVFFGYDGLRAALGEIEADWADLRLEPEEIIDLGAHTLVLVRMTARVRDSDAVLDAQIAHVWQFDEDCRAIRWAVYGDRGKAMRELSATGPFPSALPRAAAAAMRPR